MLYDNKKHAFSTGIFAIIEKETRLKLSSEAGEEDEDNVILFPFCIEVNGVRKFLSLNVINGLGVA